MDTFNGPWHVTTDIAPDAKQFPYCIRDAGGWSIAYVTGVIPETEARAAAIAAVPDLVAALQAALELSAYSGDRLPIRAWKPMREQICAALAKAGVEVLP